MKSQFYIYLCILLLTTCTQRAPQLEFSKHIAMLDTSHYKSNNKPAIIIDSQMSFEEAISGSNAPESIINELTLLNLTYFSTDSLLHQGQILCNKAIEQDIKELFALMLEKQFPIAHAIPIVKYNWDDNASMLDNNTSSFCYRNISYSKHAKGLAIDINPYFNPVIWKTAYNRANKPAGAIYEPEKDGRFSADNEIVLAFKKHHFHWGGDFKAKYDYHHFEKSGYWKPRKIVQERTAVKTQTEKTAIKAIKKSTSKDKYLDKLAYSLTKKYFSSIFYHEKGKVVDWIVLTANKSGINNLTINIIDNKVSPKEYQITPIQYPIPFLKHSLHQTLIKNNYPADFISSAILEIKVVGNTVYCSARLLDINNKEYIYQMFEVESTKDIQ